MSDETAVPGKATSREDRSWVVLAVSIAFVVSVVAVFTYLMRDSFTPEPVKAFDLTFTDDFNRRSNDGGLGTTGHGQEWVSVRGLWNVDAGRAVIAFPDKDFSLAVIGHLKNGAVMAKISGKTRCGLVARYVDDKNFLSLVRVPLFGVWNLVEVRDGTTTVLGKLPDVGESTITVKLESGDRVVNAYVGASTLSVVSPSQVSVGSVGFIGYTGEAVGCVWGDLWAFSGR
jgi:hypothetical protein